jgi:hypothetical protein
MVLHAMGELGAGPDRLRSYAERYTAFNHVPRQPAHFGVLAADTWRDVIGQRSREADLRAFFQDQVRARGRDVVLRETLPVLAEGVAASATHGLMRLAYALLREDDGEVGAALGYWAATFLGLPERPQGQPARSIPELLSAMRAQPDIAALVPRDMLLWHWIRMMAALPAYGALIGGVHPDRVTLADVRQAGVLLYAGTQSFEALHVVTGAHWLRIVGPSMRQPEMLVARFVDVALSLYPKIGMPDLPCADQIERLRRSPAPDWSVLSEAAIASDDEHDHSLVFTAREEERFTGDQIYRRLAALRLGLI